MKRNWFWGIVCILGAILIFGNLFGIIQFNLSLWKIAGTLICLSVIIDGIKERSFYSPLFGIAIIFYLFKEDLGFEDISLWLLLLATWLLAWGLTSIIHPKKRHIEIKDIEYSTNSIINITSSFGEKVQYIQTNDLQSYSGQFKLRIPKSLHRSLSMHAKEEGISMNQYCLYLLAKNDAEYKKERR